jgi:hypothetical protein
VFTYSKALKTKRPSRISPAIPDDGDSTSINSVEKRDTEFSWMLVPPSPNMESFDNCSMESCHNSIGSNEEEEEAEDRHPQEGDVCVICLEAFCPGDRLRLLPCRHSFHVGCIDRWLSGSHSFDDCYTAGCPTCEGDSVDFRNRMHLSDGSVPSWAFARIGNVLARDSQHF